jgi:TonB family protein
LTERSDREPRTAAIKLIPSGDDDDAQLERWAAAAKLDHPHLMRLFECGQCELDGGHYLYVVMEYAEEDLSQIIPQRALTPAEASDVLPPAAQALAYLHQAGFVHGRVKASNILAVNNVLKISADGLCRKGEHIALRKLAVYDAPEVSTEGLSPEADAWSLGVTLVAMLTQYPPDFTNTSPPQAIVPETIPQPLREAARRWLTVDPRQRGSVADIERSLQSPPTPLPEKKTESRPEQKPAQRSTLVPAVIVIVILLLVVGVRAFLTHKPAIPQAEQSAPTSGTASQPSPPPFSEPLKAGKGTVHGKVAKQVLPEVSESARNTITGRIKIPVRVSVDAAGRVTDAKLASHSGSKYFSRQALEAARQWTFTPAQMNGKAVASEWNLHFQFARTGPQVSASEARP